MAVRVVRSIASSVATDPIVGGSGRFNDFSSENWPLVRPAGRSASSKRRDSAPAARRAARQMKWSPTCRVDSTGTTASALDAGDYEVFDMHHICRSEH